jgi:hypothetical protein
MYKHWMPALLAAGATALAPFGSPRAGIEQP